MLLVGCLAGCGDVAASQGGIFPTEVNYQQVSNESPSNLAAFVEDGVECTEFIGGGYPDTNYEEQFMPYAQFGLTYDSDRNELHYNGKIVRWFEDYYPISEDGAQAGKDFFNENGVVDVYAVRDLNSFVYTDDGSFDPGGKLIGVKEFSEEEFAARDIEAIKNPPLAVSIAGNPPTTNELEDMAKEYEAFGITYDIKNDQWYFNGEKVRFFYDVLTSNGEGLTSGKFKGSIRTSGSASGTVDVYTVRDFANPDTSGNGTLTGIVVKRNLTNTREKWHKAAPASAP